MYQEVQAKAKKQQTARPQNQKKKKTNQGIEHLTHKAFLITFTVKQQYVTFKRSLCIVQVFIGIQKSSITSALVCSEEFSLQVRLKRFKV